MTIYFDMDGTIADFYSVDGWLDALINSDVRPYREAKPLLNMSRLAKYLNALQRKGFQIGIISWCSRDGSAEFNEAVRATKMAWLHKHLRSVTFDEIHIVEYGVPKTECGGGILFDDEEGNRTQWGELAFDEKKIFEILKELMANDLTK